MSEFTDRLMPVPQRKTISKFRPVAIVLTPVAAILFQVYVPRFLEFLAFLDLPLLVTVYFSLMRRSPVAGCLLGAAIGLMQDSLSHQPLGILGIVKTLVGYFSASASQRFDVENIAIRFLLGFFFYIFHHILYWVLIRALLGQPGEFDLAQEVFVAVLNAIVAVPLFQLLDKLRVRV